MGNEEIRRHRAKSKEQREIRGQTTDSRTQRTEDKRQMTDDGWIWKLLKSLE
jgi:hypothetical protein